MNATPLDRATLEALETVASPEEIDTLVILLDGMTHGRIEAWYTGFIYEIICRLAALTSTTTPRSRTQSETPSPPA